ncbi:TPA: molybdopterin oxidoreductase family protein [Staphylococcus aureus]|nr:molybdopterin oxidoreductase family protein [Staphylococcus aureus]
MQEHLVVTLDGKDYLVEPGTNLLEFIKSQDTFVPSICYNESMGPIQTCDTCTVEIDGKIERSCSTVIDRPMTVNTVNNDVKDAQKEALDRILEKHMLYCTVCDYNNGDCEIHNTMDAWGLQHQTYEYKEKPYEKDYGPFYRYDPNQCILCGRCVEACQDIEVNETIRIDWDREHPRVIWDNDVPINESSCVSCGQCATVCPCNAMMEVNMEGNAGYMTDTEPGSLAAMIDLTKKAEPGYGPLFAISDSEAEMRKERIKKTKTVCTYCGVGCSFEVWTKDREILKVQPSHDSPANKIATCVKGKFSWGHINSDQRLTKPLVRKNGEFHEVEWDEALNVIADNFTSIKEKHGPDALSFISSSKATNEESYLMQKLARQVIGTNNVDNCSRYCQAPATKGLFRTVGHGGDSSTAISNLLLVTGNYRRPGTGAYPLRGHNNVQGCSDMGSMPDKITGYQSIEADDIRAKFEKEYGVKLNPKAGKDNHEMVEGIHDGQIHSLYLYGEDTGIVDSNINFVQAAFEKLDFMVVQDEFLTFTATYADVVLPASPSLEKDGTFTNTERRIQRLYQALKPLGDSKPDWKIFQAIANKLGFDWNYKHPSEIMDEIARLTPLYAGVSYERLEGFNSLQWPVHPDGTDEPILYLEGFNFDNGKAKLFPLSFDNYFKQDEVYDIHVNNGRLLEHFHEGNMTYQTPMIKYKVPRAFVEISPELAEDRGIHEGAEVKLISETGEAVLQVHVTDRVKGKEIYIPLNNDAMENGDLGAINLLTNSDVDQYTDTPSYKRTSCRLEVITKRGKSPLNPNNFRVNKKRHPQYSVQVQKKWERPDYVFPGNQVDK